MDALKFNRIKRQRQEKEAYEAVKARVAAMSEEEKEEYFKEKEETHKKVKELLLFSAIAGAMVDKKY